MGLAAAATVAVAVLVAVTLLPALLGIAGDRVTRSRVGGGPRRVRAAVSMGERWARFVTRFRVPVVIVGVAGLLTVAAPLTHLRLGLPDDGTAPAGSTQHKAYDLIQAYPGRLRARVQRAAHRRHRRRRHRLGGDRDHRDPEPARRGRGQPAPAQRGRHDRPAHRDPEQPGLPDEATTDLVNGMRDQEATLHRATGADIAVTGQTAVNIDISEKIGGALLPYLGIIVGLAMLLLMLVFRSVLVPLKATLGFLLSIGATLGAVVAVFQWGWLGNVLGVTETGPIMNLLPVLLVGILFGLAMDYQVFLVTRVREEYVHGADAQSAVVTGVRHSARVVTAAAIIMTSVFSGFILSDQMLVKSIGFALAFGVLVDAFVVRMTIVPAVLSLLGRAGWWLPRPLDRILPAVDVEGSALTAAPAPAYTQTREPELASSGRK
jgi:RND superfamily putative drug exporter